MRLLVVFVSLCLFSLAVSATVVRYPKPTQIASESPQIGWLIYIPRRVGGHEIDIVREKIADTLIASPPYNAADAFIESAYFGKNRTYIHVRVTSAAGNRTLTAIGTVLFVTRDDMMAEMTLTFKTQEEGGGVQVVNVDHGLDRVDQRSARVLDGQYHYRSDAATTTIYILDTGVRVDHVEFSLYGRISFLANYVGDGIMEDCHGHGTHVASLAAGTTYGTAKRAQIRAVKVLGCDGTGSTEGIVYALEDIADSCSETDDIVINLSLGAFGTSALMTNAISYVRSKCSVIVVAAAGNSNGDACYHVPVSIPGVVGVGASYRGSDGRDYRTYFSNYGNCVDMYAPGLDLRGASISSPFSSVTMRGTSMASPLVAGVSAIALNLVKSNATFANYSRTQRAAEALDMLLRSVTQGMVDEPAGYSAKGILYAGLTANASRTFVLSISPLAMFILFTILFLV